MKSLLKRLFALFWITFVLIVVVGAIVLTSARAFLASAETYQADIIDWLSEQLQQPVEVTSIDARMIGMQPTLLLENVRLLDPEGEKAPLQFEELRVGIDPWNSLLRRRITLGLLTVVGAELSVRRDPRGKVHVEGLALELNRSGGTVAATGADLAQEWLLSQSHLLIRDSTVHWRDEMHGDRDLRFDIAKIELRNQGSRHQLEGVVILPSDLGRTLQVAADFTDAGDEGGWQGKFYVNGLGLRLAPLLEKVRPKQVKAGFGQLDMELWGEWADGRLTRLRGEAGIRNFVLQGTNGEGYRLELLNTTLHWQRRDEGWRLDFPRVLFIRDGRAWPDTHLRLVATGEGDERRYVIRSSFLRLGDVAGLIPFLEPRPTVWRESVMAMHPRGDLRDLYIDLHPSAPLQARFAVSARLQGVTMRAWKKLPAVEGMSGLLWADGESGVLRLDCGKGSVDFPRLARAPWRFDRLQGEISWQKEKGGWYLYGDGLKVSNADVQATAELELVVPGKGVPPFLDLRVAFEKGRVARASRYYPTAIIPEKLLEWLDRSLLAGEVARGSLILHGRLKKGLFPYRNGEGMFEVGFDARDVALEYLPGWPRIDSLDVGVLFRGGGMRIDARRGRIAGVRINSSHVRIDDYRDRMVKVRGEVRGEGGRMLQFLRDAPIAVEAEPALVRMSMAGSAVLDLRLDIPLRKQPVEYRGTVRLDENSFRYRLGDGYLEATNINGEIHFDRNGYRAERLEAFLFDRPAEIEVNTSREEGGMATRISVDGRLLPAALARQLQIPLLNRLRGESAFRAELKINFRRVRPGPLLELEIDSTLAGITSSLPPPLAKPDEGAIPLYVGWDDASQRVRFRYGDVLNGDIRLGGADGKVPAGAGYLHFGRGRGQRPVGPVLRITGVLQEIAPGEWWNLLADVPFPSADEGKDVQRLRVDLELERLHLRSSREEFSVEATDAARNVRVPARLPALTVGIHELTYEDLNLGRLAFRALPDEQGMRIRQLVLDTPYMKIQGSAEWRMRGEPWTSASLLLTAPRTHTMLEALGLAAMIHGEDLRIEGELEWPGSPMDFSLKTLQGDLKLAIGSGRIESVEPGAGRLFGLFSLQALPRRLTLDFRDLFGKGFRFDSIKGEIRLAEGNAFTKNLLLEGPTARIAVSGRTGYVARDYDQHILVIPGDGSNLFVAGALAWGPQAGALIWMAEKLLRLDKVAQYVYHVTGSWEEPVITRGREKPPSAPPDAE